MQFVKFFHTVPPPYGGVQVFVKRAMLGLCKKGLISGAYKRGAVVGFPKDLLSLLDEFPRHSRSFLILFELRKLYCSVKSYRLVHVQTSLTTSFAVWVVHFIFHKPIVYTIHNQMIDQEFSCLFPWDIWFFRSLAHSRQVQVMTVNQVAKNKLMERGFSFANDIIVSPAYLPPVEIGEPQDYLCGDLCDFIKSHKKFALFYAESFATYNSQDIYGTEVVIDAYIKASRSCPELALVFCIANIGADKDKLVYLEDKVNKACLDSVYWQVGAIPEMWPLLKSATMLIRPTITDGDSIMVREALSFGLPVIASDVTTRPEGCIVYQTTNYDELHALIVQVATNPYKKVFPQVDRLEELISLYNEMLENHD